MVSPAPAEGATKIPRVIVENLGDIEARPPPSWRLEFSERTELYEVVSRDDGRILGTLETRPQVSLWYACRYRDGQRRTFDFRPDACWWVAEQNERINAAEQRLENTMSGIIADAYADPPTLTKQGRIDPTRKQRARRVMILTFQNPERTPADVSAACSYAREAGLTQSELLDAYGEAVEDA